MNHVIILGPGRCGTTVLWYLLKEYGVDTGEEAEVIQNFRDELLSGKRRMPYIVKGTGALSRNLNENLDRHKMSVDHIFFCVRRYEPMLASHIKKKKDTGKYKGLSLDALTDELSVELPETLGITLFNLIERNHPFTVIEFPRSAQDEQYCYDKLTEGLSLDREQFSSAWRKTVNPNLIRHG